MSLMTLAGAHSSSLDRHGNVLMPGDQVMVTQHLGDPATERPGHVVTVNHCRCTDGKHNASLQTTEVRGDDGESVWVAGAFLRGVLPNQPFDEPDREPELCDAAKRDQLLAQLVACATRVAAASTSDARFALNRYFVERYGEGRETSVVQRGLGELHELDELCTMLTDLDTMIGECAND